VISHTLLFYTGAADDPRGASGLAHYLEHLLFKGTPTTPEGEYSKHIEALGGQYNAFTSYDMTGYYVTIAKEHLPTVMRLEADRMQHLTPPETAYAKEREVILEERRLRVDTRPNALLSEEMRAAQFKQHPYGRPIIGWAHEMRTLDKDKAMRFYRTYYTPANAVLVLVGDITAKQAEQLARTHYGSWQGKAPPERNWLQEPPQRTRHRLAYHDASVKKPRLVRRYTVPSLGTAQSPAEERQAMALMLGEEWLGHPRYGVLYNALVKEQELATEVSVYYDGFRRDTAQFGLRLVPAKGVSLPELEQALDRTLSQALDNVPSETDITRARNQFKASTIYAQESIDGMGSILGRLLMIGKEPGWFNQWQTLVDTPTPGDIHAALRKTLAPKTGITGYLMPAVAPEQEATQ
jgi:zinc protease